MKVKKVYIVAMAFVVAYAAGKIYASTQKDAPTSTPSPTGELYSFSDTVFQYDGTDFDITERAGSVTSIIGCTPVGDAIVVEGHISPQNGYFGVFDTETKSFERDILGAQLTWHDDDITTALYASGGDVIDYDGKTVASYEMTEPEYIQGITFVDDNTRVEVKIGTGEDNRTETFDLA